MLGEVITDLKVFKFCGAIRCGVIKLDQFKSKGIKKGNLWIVLCAFSTHLPAAQQEPPTKQVPQ